MKKDQKIDEGFERGGSFQVTAKAVVVRDDGKVLMLKRSATDPTAPGKLDLPGGGLNPGELVEEALRREIQEETGIKAAIGPVLYVFDFEKDKDGAATHCKGIRYLAFYEDGEAIESSEHENVEWIGLEEAIDKMSDKGFERDKKEALVRAKEYLELKKGLDGWKRCQADFENYKKRQSDLQSEFRKYAKEEIILQIIPVIDNFHASTDHVPEEQKDNGWVTGIMYIQKQLENVLKENGIEEIETKVGDDFNPEVHEALESKNEESELQNKIEKIIQRGYRIDKRVIRPVKVVVH